MQDYSIWSEEETFFTPCKTRSANFESSWLKTFALHKLEAFDILLRNWVESPQKELKSKKHLFSFFKGSSSRKRYEIIRKILNYHNANMELKNVNPNCDNVVVSNLINIHFLNFWKIVKIEFKNKDHMFFFV